ncbi:hypothetical protein J437_LFUL010219 [Ladona fulva]|uniref:Uncharacterized protein n=1 Tax=Ladona fulva TaxID=123851 RepID=A0A8K0P2V8_LADFU|nr:hypothetical protein J437_LFUL010219 [Ladona fulva]
MTNFCNNLGSLMKPAVNFVSSWRNGLKAEKFKLHHENPEVFILCQWQRKCGISPIYIIYRVLLAVTFFGILISSLCETGKNEAKSNNNEEKYYITTPGDVEVVSTETVIVIKGNNNLTDEPTIDVGPVFVYKWPIYLTNWGITVCTAQAILGAVLVIQKKLSENKPDGEMKKSMSLAYKCYWILYTTASVTALVITVLYWGLVYNSTAGPPSAVGILVHGINSILMLLDITLVAHPLPLQHFYFPVLLAFIYSIFTIIYYLAGGTSRNGSHKIYPQLDWNKPFSLALPTAFGALILVLMVHSLLYGYSELRSYIGRRLKTPKHFYIGEGNDNRGVDVKCSQMSFPSPVSHGAKNVGTVSKANLCHCSHIANSALLTAGPPSAVGILVHGINSILMLLDITLVAHPLPLQHFYFPVLLAFIYSIFTIIYYLAGGTSRNGSHKIYPQLDWNKPFSLALPTAFGALILVLMVHSLLYGYSELRSYIGRRLKTPKHFYIGEGNDNRGVDVKFKNRVPIRGYGFATVLIVTDQKCGPKSFAKSFRPVYSPDKLAIQEKKSNHQKENPCKIHRFKVCMLLSTDGNVKYRSLGS